MPDRWLALLGVLPPFLMLWYAERFERRVKEPHADWRYRTMVAAALVCVPVAWVQRALALLLVAAREPQRSLFEAYVLAACVEETAKVSCLYVLSRLRLSPRTRYGAFLYALHAAAGFALVENVLVMLDAPDTAALTVRFVLRAYLVSPMHLFAGGVVGYLWARRRFDGGVVGLSGGLGLAILIHGSYDALLLGVERLPGSRGALIVACAALAIAIPLCGVLVLRFMAEKLRDDDARAGR